VWLGLCGADVLVRVLLILVLVGRNLKICSAPVFDHAF